MKEFFSILNGTLLGDACVLFDNYKYKKYFVYKITTKDQNFLLWFNAVIKKFGINKSWITEDSRSNNFSLNFYINNCPYKELTRLRDKWYKQTRNKTVKIVPKDLELTSNVLLHWYLGDGCLVRRKNDKNRVPYIVLATNTFSKNDINFLIQKLRALSLSFYPVRYKSGFTGKKCGYCLYSKTQDGTPYRFFKLIGDCPKEIVNCKTGVKGIYHETKYFVDKWPTEEDMIKILSNVKGIGKILRARREELHISREELTKMLHVNKDYIRKIESDKRNPNVGKFRQILKALDLNSLKIS